MPISIPDKGAGIHNHQSVLFGEDLGILTSGMTGLDCVLSGLFVTGGADMTPAVSKGAVLSNWKMFAIAAADITVTTADATYPRIDLAVVNSSGALAVRAGTPAANPKPPARTINDVVFSQIYVPANATAIASGNCTSRAIYPHLPVTIYRTTTAETTNTTASAVNILDKTNSGVVIPDGLFTAGRILRVRILGNLLLNSGSPTLTLTVIFGGTTMFADTTVASAASAVRAPWMIDLYIIAQANSDQAMHGTIWLTPLDVARTAATAGIGDMAFANTSNRLGTVCFGGSSAVDANAANRTLQVQFTMSVSNSANEIVVEGATVELM